MLPEVQNTNVLLNGGNNAKEQQSSVEPTARIPSFYDGIITEEQRPFSQLLYQPFIEEATREEFTQDNSINNISLVVNGDKINEELRSFLQIPHQSPN
ncbi:hypothetical protein F8M41_007179 [Gigaspora margarita]|uniref:Uncharacterized protein n=1 Tax=Gigaspora margarita TaxID=4874 RepID=A0A8H3X796_GIGMA|nr:hypothetical protein F8M41_007179 [Gigaspora margarita]